MYELKDKEFKEVLKKQAAMANVPVSFFDPYFNGGKMPEHWFSEYAWSEQTQEKFKKWLIKYLIARGFPREIAKTKAAMFIFEYGWRTQDQVELFAAGHYKKLRSSNGRTSL